MTRHMVVVRSVTIETGVVLGRVLGEVVQDPTHGAILHVSNKKGPDQKFATWQVVNGQPRKGAIVKTITNDRQKVVSARIVCP